MTGRSLFLADVFPSSSSLCVFAYSRVLVLHWHIAILTTGAISACLCFCIVEKMSDEETEETSEIDSLKSKN
uniref:Uncharacterized protein n=1 Tax=Ditylenchus dipsaci TaxID=166011 RepID=A0A915D0T5_9BILA